MRVLILKSWSISYKPVYPLCSKLGRNPKPKSE
jgi:hypothetical protein